MATSSKPRGRVPATGRFDTRTELCAWVWSQWASTAANISDIARQCRVSAGVVSKILDTKEGRTTTAPNPPPQPHESENMQINGKDRLFNAYLIDPLARTITRVDYTGTLDHMYQLLECAQVDRMVLNRAHDMVFFSDYLPEDPMELGYFGIRQTEEVIFGRGLVVGDDGLGGNANPKITLDELRKMIGFRE